jgi:hypothetical protein
MLGAKATVQRHKCSALNRPDHCMIDKRRITRLLKLMLEFGRIQ